MVTNFIHNYNLTAVRGLSVRFSKMKYKSASNCGDVTPLTNKIYSQNLIKIYCFVSDYKFETGVSRIYYSNLDAM